MDERRRTLEKQLYRRMKEASETQGLLAAGDRVLVA